MKLKALNGILIIDILSILLILSIVLIPSGSARVILGLPFVLFFPGYTLVAALFVKKEEMDDIQRIALSCVSSIAVTALIGFVLNYTVWGIRLEPVLYFIATFIFVTSVIALIRKAQMLKINKFTTESILRLPNWGSSTFNKYVSIILGVAIFCAFGILGYSIAAPKLGERFTEFYILGNNGQTESYPIEYVINNGQITQVIYGNGTVDTINGFGMVVLGIVNKEQQTAVYSVKMTINGDPVNFSFDGTITNYIGPIELKKGEKWEQNIGIIPHKIGDNQKVVLLLFNGTETTAEDSLYFWINVKQAQ